MKPDTAWPHAPVHRLSEPGAYFVTAATYQKQLFFVGGERLAVLQRGLLRLAAQYGWHLEAWAVFANHYHFVAHAPPDADSAESLRAMLAQLHVRTAKWINRLDQSAGRRVWFNFWETELTYERSYLARLQYTHQNAVKHELVALASQYPWCSASWLELSATPAQIKTLQAIKTDRVHVLDDFQVTGAW